MSHPTTRLRIVTLAALAFGLIAGPALAATRYAAPAGVGASPCLQSAPCSLNVATGVGLADGDVVRLLPGNYSFANTISVGANDVTIEGEGAPAPIAKYTGDPGLNAIQVFGNNVTLRNIEIQGVTDGASYMVSFNSGVTGGVVDRMSIRNEGTAAALVAELVTVRDSVLTSVTDGGVATRIDGTLTNSTVVADAPNSSGVLVSSAPTRLVASLVVRNSIIRGGSLGTDIRVANEGPGETATLDIDYSAYRSGSISQLGAGTVNVNVGTHNVFSNPLLVDFIGGADIHQRVGSRTIDAGTSTAVASSTGDIDSQPRTIGAAPDIGADEFDTVPTVATAAASAVTTTGATLNGTVNPNGTATTYRFEYGPTTSYGSVTGDVVIPVGASTVVVSAPISGLTPGAQIHYRLVATNTRGQSVTADATVTLTSVPAVPVDPAPALGVVTLSPSTIRSGRRSVATFSLSERARVTMVIDRLAPGRKVAGVCRTTARTGVRCTKLVRRGVIAATVNASATAKLTVPARVGTRVLAPGRYRLTITARDLVTGKLSTKRTVILTVRP